MPRSLLIVFAVAGALAVADVAAHDFEALSPSNAEPSLLGRTTISRSGAAAAAACGEPSSTNLVVWFDGRDIDGADNGTLTDSATFQTWEDKGSLALDMTQATAGARPTFIQSCFNSKACARFSTDDFMQAGTAVNYKFLSDGSDYTAYVVFKTTLSNPDTFYVLLSTGSTGSGAVGMNMFFDDRSSIPREDKIVANIANGSAFPVNFISADDAVPAAAWHAVVMKLDEVGSGNDVNVYVDGTLSGGAASTAAYSASNPAAPLTLGRAGSSALGFLGGDVAQVLIYSVAHSDGERDDVEDWIDCEYGADITIAQTHLYIGDSITAGFSVTAWPTRLDDFSSASFTTTNRAVSGAYTSAMLSSQWRTQSQGQAFDRVFVLGGVNDIDDSTDTVSGIYSNLSTIYDEAAAEGADVFALTVMPYKPAASWSSARHQNILDLNDLIETTAGVTVVDTFTFLADPNDLEQLLDAYSLDDIHPNQTGADEIATRVQTAAGL